MAASTNQSQEKNSNLATKEGVSIATNRAPLFCMKLKKCNTQGTWTYIYKQTVENTTTWPTPVRNGSSNVRQSIKCIFSVICNLLNKCFIKLPSVTSNLNIA